MIYKDNFVSGSEKSIPYHTEIEGQEDSTEVVFYFTDRNKTNNGISYSLFPGLSYLIQLCVPVMDKRSLVHVFTLLQCIHQPKKLPEILKSLEIKPCLFGLPLEKEYFPNPGTYVEQRFIPFLEQGIEPFKTFEFESVAMELRYDNRGANDEEEGDYVYVKILRESERSILAGDLGRMYTVVTGNPDIYTEQVPIYRLFRFVRRTNNPGTELQLYDSEPINAKPFDETCHKIRNDLMEAWKLPVDDRNRVIRRILLKWHPDKNRGNEEYCKNVFHYVRIVISRLENAEIVEENVKDDISRGLSHFSNSASTYYDNISRAATRHAQAYYSNYEEYRRHNMKGKYAHNSAANDKRPDAYEAKRWMRQAKNDLKAALTFCPVADNVEGYNWVCYLCHQVNTYSFFSAYKNHLPLFNL